jgi:hypothetical protein
MYLLRGVCRCRWNLRRRVSNESSEQQSQCQGLPECIQVRASTANTMGRQKRTSCGEDLRGSRHLPIIRRREGASFFRWEQY